MVPCGPGAIDGDDVLADLQVAWTIDLDGRQARNPLCANDGDVIGRVGADDLERHGPAVGERHGGRYGAAPVAAGIRWAPDRRASARRGPPGPRNLIGGGCVGGRDDVVIGQIRPSALSTMPALFRPAALLDLLQRRWAAPCDTCATLPAGGRPWGATGAACGIWACAWCGTATGALAEVGVASAPSAGSAPGCRRHRGGGDGRDTGDQRRCENACAAADLAPRRASRTVC